MNLRFLRSSRVDILLRPLLLSDLLFLLQTFLLSQTKMLSAYRTLLLLPATDIGAHQYPLNIFSFYLPPAVLVTIVGLSRSLGKNVKHP